MLRHLIVPALVLSAIIACGGELADSPSCYPVQTCSATSLGEVGVISEQTACCPAGAYCDPAGPICDLGGGRCTAGPCGWGGVDAGYIALGAEPGAFDASTGVDATADANVTDAGCDSCADDPGNDGGDGG